MRITPLLIFFIVSSFIASSQSTFELGYYGALKNLMHKGDLSSTASLEEFENVKNLYALGAVEELKGEIIILDSRLSVSSVKKVTNESSKGVIRSLVVDHSFNYNACLLVYATVERWATFPISNKIKTYEELEVYVEQIALEHGINTEEPFPFMIEGITASFDWHVIDWPDGDKEHSHEKHIHSGLYGTIENTEVKMLGFYSKAHHTVFTHHTTNMHIHVNSIQATGHVDNMILGVDMVLKLPQ
jgi:acetolactate decarboxylase